MRKIIGIFIAALLITATSLTLADWDPGDDHKMHHPQLPDLETTGTDLCMFGDVLDFASLADDFRCAESGPITDIHIWTSYDEDLLPQGGVGSITFQIRIRADSGGLPGAVLWDRTFNPGMYTVRLYDQGWQCWQCPWTNFFDQNSHRNTYQYNFFIDENDAFNQLLSTVYWLEVRWVHGEVDFALGWKTTTLDLRWRSPAQSFDGSTWTDLLYHNSHDFRNQEIGLAFVITGGSQMTITSQAFENGGRIPVRFTCDAADGRGVSPPLTINNIPSNSDSLVIIVDDPDANDWVHWIVYDIDIPWNWSLGIAENAGAPGGGNLPSGAEHGTNTDLKQYYQGPCPPIPQTHRYFFTAFALDAMLNLPAGASRAQLENAMAGHIIETAQLWGTYSREEQPLVNVLITQPRDALYLWGWELMIIPRIMPVPISIVLGSVTVIAEVVGSGVDRVDFTAENLIGGINAFAVNSPPYEWVWNDPPGAYVIAAVARDSSNNELGGDMVLVIKFL